MDEEQKQEIRESLKEQIQTLTRDLSEYEDRAGTVDLDQPIGRLSRMDSMINQGILLSSINKSKSRLAGLKRALQAIDDPDFGYCCQCGEEISFKRLKALPESELCILCAE